MTLSEEIKQTKFENAHVEAVLNIHFTSNWLFKLFQAQLDQFEISHEQYNILRILRGNRGSPYCLHEIQGRMLNRTANTTRLVEKLRKRGLLSRRPIPSNRRSVYIRITEEGLALLEEMDAPTRKLNRRVQKALSVEDANRISGILDGFRDRLDVSGLVSQE